MTITRLASFVLFAPVLSLVAAACGTSVTTGGTGGTGGSGGSGGGAGEFAACTGPGQCVIVPSTCCGVCGTPELADVVAVNSAQATAFRDSMCPGDVGCPACAAADNPNLYALCEGGQCVAKDARTSEVSACAADSDCVLRYGMGCCESTCMGEASQVTAVSVQGFQSVYPKLGCDAVDCQKCLPQYPMYTEALCDGGHCVVGMLL